MIRTTLLLIAILFSLAVIGQNSKVQLAFQYYQSKEFEKAAVLFEELYNENNQQVYFSYTINCLLEIKEFQKAEKMINRQIRKNKKDLQNYIELGNLFNNQGKIQEAKEQFDYVIKNLPADKNMLILLANSFINRREYDYAKLCYENGRKMIPYRFNIELANVYAIQRRSQEMVDEYLDLLAEEPLQMEYVQNSLQSRMSSAFDENLKEVLKKTLIKRIQKESGNFIYSELLIWFYMQENDFTSAIIQAKALDKRRREGGMRLVELGNIALSNNLFTQAKDAYEYVLKYGNETPYYIEAKLGYIDVVYKQVVVGQISGEMEYKKVEELFVSTINEFQGQQQTFRLVKDLAHLKAFYLNKSEESIQLLRKLIETTKLDAVYKGACKIELGDILLLRNEISEAILEYAQAAKMNDANDLGDKAKYKRATLAFYTGNFPWAQAQLDVLKEGTSKLIANDAFQLSMLIKDNSGLDSSGTALKYFARSEMYLQQNKESDALLTLDTLENEFKTDALIDDVLYLKARVYEKTGKIEKTIFYLDQITQNYYSGLLGDDANYKLAQIYDYQLNDPKKASEYYKKILFDFPGSIYVSESRKRYRFFRGDKEDKPE